MKVKALTPKLIQQVRDLSKKVSSEEKIIIDRINYIMQSVFKLFKIKNANWYFYGAAEGEVGDLWRHYGEDYISIIVEGVRWSTYHFDMEILLKDGAECILSNYVPTRWLFEDFEKELVDGKEKLQQKRLQLKMKQKETDIQNKKEQRELINAAKKKLSKKELAALTGK